MALQDQIAAAIKDGLSGDAIVDEDGDDRLVYVGDVVEPIRVKSDDVIIPDALKSLGPGIRLDVQAILAER